MSLEEIEKFSDLSLYLSQFILELKESIENGYVLTETVPQIAYLEYAGLIKTMASLIKENKFSDKEKTAFLRVWIEAGVIISQSLFNQKKTPECPQPAGHTQS